MDFNADFFKAIPEKSVIMLSGGVDSTVLAHVVRKERPKLRGVSINYGQTNFKRTRKVTNVVGVDLEIPIEIMDVPNLSASFSGFLEEEYDDHYVIMCEHEEPMGSFISVVSLAASWAAAIGYDAILVGYNKDDREGDSDRYANAPIIYQHVESAITASIGRPFKILLPFWDIYKGELIKTSSTRGIPVDKTWSCWRDGVQQCGVCPGCLDRKDAYKSSGIADVTAYITP
jgi:7-cyano-7-deazaguanine synthase